MHKYDAEFKRTVIDELLGGQKRAAQICRERRIDITTLRRWRQEYEQRGSAAWSKPDVGAPSPEAKVAELERLIGQLTVENLVLKKALQQARSLSRCGRHSSVS